MIFNINQYVRVKLTPHGKKLLEEDHKEFWANVGYEPYAFKLPEEDADGWSKWQFWTLMKYLGKHCSLGMNLPFETNIEIIEEQKCTNKLIN